MKLNVKSLEGGASHIRTSAGFGSKELPRAIEVAVRTIGPEAVVLGDPGIRGRLVHGRIVVARDHPDINSAVSAALGRWALEREGFTGTFAKWKDASAYVGAAICAPPKLVLRAYALHGENLRALSRVFGMSQTAMALRLGEVLRSPRAVVTVEGEVLARHVLGGEGWRARPCVALARRRLRVAGVRRTALRGGCGVDRGRVELRRSAT